MLDRPLTEEDEGSFFLTGTGIVVEVVEVLNNGRAFGKLNGYMRARVVRGLHPHGGFKYAGLILYTLDGKHNQDWETPNDLVQQMTEMQVRGYMGLAAGD